MYERIGLKYDEIFFEWDDNKDHYNFVNHGIHFKTAAKVFLDPDALIRIDEEHDKEERYDVLGKVGKVLFVVCTVRDKNTIRLISARIASKPREV